MQRKLSLLMVIALAVVMLVAGCSSNDNQMQERYL